MTLFHFIRNKKCNKYCLLADSINCDRERVRKVILNKISLREVFECKSIPKSSQGRAVITARNTTIKSYSHTLNIGNGKIITEERELSQRVATLKE